MGSNLAMQMKTILKCKKIQNILHVDGLMEITLPMILYGFISSNFALSMLI